MSHIAIDGKTFNLVPQGDGVVRLNREEASALLEFARRDYIRQGVRDEINWKNTETIAKIRQLFKIPQEVTTIDFLTGFLRETCNHGFRDVDVPNNRTICRGCGKVEPLRTPADDEKLYLVHLADDLIREFVRPGRIITEQFETAYKSWFAGLRTLDAAWGLLANCWTGNWDAFAPPDWIDRARAWEKRWRAMPLKQAQADVTQQKIDDLEARLANIIRVAKHGL